MNSRTFFLPAVLFISVFFNPSLYGQTPNQISLMANIVAHHFIPRPLLETVLQVPRAPFFPSAMGRFLAEDRELPDVDAGLTPAPSAILRIYNALELGKGKRVLILGRGAGYAAALGAAAGAEVLLVEESSGADRYRSIIESISLEVEVLQGTWKEEAIFYRLTEEEASFDAVFVHGGVIEVPEVLVSLIASPGAGAFPLTESSGIRNTIILKKGERGVSLSSVHTSVFEALREDWDTY